VQAKKAKLFGESVLKLLGMNCGLFPEFIDTKTRSQYEIKMPLSNGSNLLVDGEYMHEFDTMEAIQYVDLNEIDTEDYYKQVIEFRGEWNQRAHMREVYQSKKLLYSLNEENAK
jgi:hypothetical protein